MTLRALRPVLVMATLLAALLLLLPFSTPLFHAVFPGLERPLYTRASFLDLTLAHLQLVLGATGAAALVGVSAGILVTREAGKRLLPLVSATAAIGQTFPPVAVLALTVPVLGYGSGATLVALFVYALLPIIANTVAGLEGVEVSVRDAADGMGFTPLRRLLQVELPLAAPVILAGIRTSAIINVGTATVGSTVGALSLGSPIIEGLSGSNTAYVVQGAMLVAVLALLIDRLFALVSEGEPA
ncbi:ABC transporter permease [Bosea sp. Root381]|uniref:ABC transporter permease n=1 Tax=Bosea sp. Root381 TaxID=1736524 RepID=UPI000B217634|nr:ABC transporter permease [Bosea sp. Root381]